MADGDNTTIGYENQQSLVKYDNPVLVIKHPEKPTTGSDGKVCILELRYTYERKKKLVVLSYLNKAAIFGENSPIG